MNGYLVIVSCGGSKVWDRYPTAGPTAARDVYTSSVFRTSRRYAEQFGQKWLILSAKFGFIEPDFVITGDYDVTFYGANAISAAALRDQVASSNLTEFSTIGVLGSDMYWRRAVAAIGSSGRLCHVNGNVSFPPLFHNLVNELIDHNTPFRTQAIR